LSSDLSCADGEGEELPLLSHGGCGGGSGIPPVFALSAGELSGNSGLAGNY
jgi:hypothetical protein